MGTELLRRGLPLGTPPEQLVLSQPDELRAVHGAYAAAGAEVALTCTFNLGRAATLGLQDRVGPIAAWAVRLLREAAPGSVVAGALGPVTPPAVALEPEALFRALVPPLDALVQAGVELLWLESQLRADEALEGLRLAKGRGPPVGVTVMPVERDGRLLLPDGTDPAELLLRLAAEGAVCVGVNCVEPGEPLSRLLQEVRPRLAVPLVLRASAGLPGAVLAAEPWAEAVAPLLPLLGLVGGCCQAGPGHIAALGSRLGAPGRTG